MENFLELVWYLSDFLLIIFYMGSFYNWDYTTSWNKCVVCQEDYFEEN